MIHIPLFLIRNAAELEHAWENEMSTGGLAAKWIEDFEAELAKIEAEIEYKSPDISSNSSETEDEDIAEDGVDETEDIKLYCVICDKLFASEEARNHHESSKIHRKQLRLLNRGLLKVEESATGVDSNKEYEFQNGKRKFYYVSFVS